MFGRFLLRTIAASVLIVYVGWNLYWISQATVPPSLFLAITGLPCPTTGGTRAMLLLAQGDWRGSLQVHPLAVPLALLLLATLGQWLRNLLVYRRSTVPSGYGVAWLILLSISWAIVLVPLVSGQ